MAKKTAIHTLALCVALASASWSIAARADDPSPADIESARLAFTQGLDLRDNKHDLPAAIERLKAAYDLVPTPRTGFELGKAYRIAGDLVQARATFLEIDNLPPRKNETPEAKKARTDARTQAAELDQAIPTLEIKLHGDATAAVTVDGEAVRRETLVAPRRVNPGRHIVLVVPDGGNRIKREVNLHEGEHRAVDITLPKPGTAPVAQPEDNPNDNVVTNVPAVNPVEPETNRKDGLHQTLLWTSIGGLSAGIVTGYVALTIAKGAVTDHCDTSTRTCDAQGLAGKSSAMTWAWIANVSLGVSLVTGILWLAIPAQKAAGTQVGVSPLPGGAVLSAGKTF